jgi:hypothetical protein
MLNPAGEDHHYVVVIIGVLSRKWETVSEVIIFKAGA